jgi:L-Ala-D/L-Glu epimerase
MSISRRNLIKGTLLSTAGILLSNKIIGNSIQSFATEPIVKSKMQFFFKPYTLELKHVFTVASNSRTTTPVILTEIKYDGLTGYGEASMPPYLGESQESVSKFLSKVDLSQFPDPTQLDDILHHVDKVDAGNTAAKASIDIALHDLFGKIIGAPLYKIWGFDPSKTPNTSYTIGIDTVDIVKQKTIEAAPYKILKVKLGKGTDKEMIEAVRSITDKPLYVDVNQGWTDKQYALDMAFWLKEQGVQFIEQPMHKDRTDDIAWLTSKSPIPIVADEAVQRYSDLIKLHGAYSGVNVKLMKCTGLREARKMIEFAQTIGMKTMIGCMTETSCAVSAAAHLSAITDYADLDGPLLVKNDCFDGMKIIEGKITLNDLPGIGVTKQ